MAAFGLLCHSVKKTEPPSAEEWALLHEFLPSNLHSDNAQFRYRLLSTTRIFLIRVLESCLSRLNKAPLDSDIAHVRQLYDRLVISCLHPNSGYQRKVAGLVALRFILQLFGPSDTQAESLVKGGSLAKRNQLIQLAGERWDWTSPSYLDRFTICLLDEVAEIRLKAMDILKDFFPGPFLASGNGYLSMLHNIGSELCDSPKFQRSECGAAVMHLLAFWGYGPTAESLLDAIESRFDRLHNDWMVSARRAPVHGFIGALNQVLQLPGSRNELVRLNQRILRLCQIVSSYMLDALAGSITGNSSSEVAPSFEEMSQAIDLIVRRYNPIPQPVDSVSISVQQQLILACCWLNLKVRKNIKNLYRNKLHPSDTLLSCRKVPTWPRGSPCCSCKRNRLLWNRELLRSKSALVSSTRSSFGADTKAPSKQRARQWASSVAAS